MVVLSISTGNRCKTSPVGAQDVDWGLFQWAKFIIPIILHSSESTVDMACEMLLQDRFFRWNEAIPEEFVLDRVDKMTEMIEVANSFDLENLMTFVKDQFLS
eukprot:c19441_g2_i2.p1 GENE.c19441_g2_i2~~c19441_g2_i2.p1  ORF type:complete len:102 (-),score=44.83 c19441_g2_i2:17-322(-)